MTNLNGRFLYQKKRKTMVRLGDLDELKKHAIEVYQGNGVELVPILMVPVSVIDNAPTVPLPDFKEGYKQAIIDGKTNFQRPQGEWITNQEYIDKEFNGHYKGRCFNSPYNCSCCGYSPEDNRPNFCPNCGAKMKGDAE